MSNITIVVSSEHKCGKSTLATQIAQALKACGFPVQHITPDGPIDTHPANVLARLEGIKQRLVQEGGVVRIEEQVANPHPTPVRRPGGWPFQARPHAEFKRPDDTEGGSHD